MPKIARALSAMEIRHLTDPGNHPVGGIPGLLLCVKKTGAKSWILRAMIAGKRCDLGLGGYADVSLAEAREKARELKSKIWDGVDPISEKRARKSALISQRLRAVTFRVLAEEYIEKKAKEYKTAKQRQKLETQLERYAFPVIGSLVVEDIHRSHIAQILTPIWETKTETADRVRLHVEKVLDLARVKGLRSGDNPARWKGNLDLSFPARSKVATVKHYASLPVRELPEFLTKLRSHASPAAFALRFLILTAVRSQNVREACWSEVDLERGIWTIPAEKMKGGRELVVPLCQEARDLLASMDEGERGYIFLNTQGNPLSDVALSNMPKRLDYAVTAHGFRSTFKEWARKYTNYQDELSELALAHVGSDATRAAYARSQLVEKRRILMDEWGTFCGQEAPPSSERIVVPIGEHRVQGSIAASA